MYAVTGTYYSYKYCDAEELALGMTTVDTGTGTTVSGEVCVPMVYSGVKYEKCTTGDYSKWWFLVICLLTIWFILKQFPSKLELINSWGFWNSIYSPLPPSPKLGVHYWSILYDDIFSIFNYKWDKTVEK